ncbi:MAG TPA: hypothetical protein VIW45_12060 [Vicinamibacterales bacterium]|jgi:hypothetical protein
MKNDNGVALVAAMMITLLMATLALVLVLTTTVETKIASQYQHTYGALYAADAIVERALNDLLGVANWNRLLDGTALSSFVDGPPTGPRTLADGVTIDLAQTLNAANCHKTGPCTIADMNAVSDDRPWGINNPRWQLFAYGPIGGLPAALLGGVGVQSPYYGVVMVGDDPAEDDGDPTLDGTGSNPGAGVVLLRGEAFGPGGVHKVVELTATRARVAMAIKVLSWREIR